MKIKKTGVLALVVVVLAIVASPVPAYAKKGFLEMLFPGIFGKDASNARPEETLVSPFDHGKPSVQGQVKKAGVEDSLNVSHRATREIGEWLMEVVSESMTFEADKYQQQMAEVATNFDEAGFKEFQTFLVESGIIEALNSQKYNVRSFVQRSPIGLNEAAVDGRYRWLFEITFMTSYMERGKENYKKNKVVPVNQNIIVKLQVGRSDKARNEHGVLIESWKGQVQKPPANPPVKQ
ncbi:MAG TPA: hypothetical protein DEA55_06625 [Rhodospirillaceae bacterium]|nr:hypothetical protein [Rhodospirillaceae bacterium]